jgi:hypothetical protein
VHVVGHENDFYYFLPTNKSSLNEHEMRRRALLVTELENQRRAENGFSSKFPSEPIIIDSNESPIGYSGNGIEWRNTGIINGQPRLEIQGSKMGGPELIVGSDFVMAAPHMARENSEILVYNFDAQGNVKSIRPFREFAVENLTEEIVTVTRIFRFPKEYDGWKSQSVSLIKSSGYKNPNNGTNDQYALHFSIGNNLYLKSDKDFIQFKIPKKALLKIAQEKNLEIGLIGKGRIEVIITETAWPEIWKYTTNLVGH